jgi:hypothetical protein
MIIKLNSTHKLIPLEQTNTQHLPNHYYQDGHFHLHSVGFRQEHHRRHRPERQRFRERLLGRTMGNRARHRGGPQDHPDGQGRLQGLLLSRPVVRRQGHGGGPHRRPEQRQGR